MFQFYPENEVQTKLILDATAAAGFSGELVVDFPHSASAKKYYLVVKCGITGVKGDGKSGKTGYNMRKSGKRV